MAVGQVLRFGAAGVVGYGIYQAGKKVYEHRGEIKQKAKEVGQEVKQDAKKAIDFSKNKLHKTAEGIATFRQEHPFLSAGLGVVPQVEMQKIVLLDKAVNK